MIQNSLQVDHVLNDRNSEKSITLKVPRWGPTTALINHQRAISDISRISNRLSMRYISSPTKQKRGPQALPDSDSALGAKVRSESHFWLE